MKVKKIETEHEKIAAAILINRVLQRDKSTTKKTQKQIATKFKITQKKVDQMEYLIYTRLLAKVGVLKILITIE